MRINDQLLQPPKRQASMFHASLRDWGVVKPLYLVRLFRFQPDCQSFDRTLSLTPKTRHFFKRGADVLYVLIGFMALARAVRD